MERWRQRVREFLEKELRMVSERLKKIAAIEKKTETTRLKSSGAALIIVCYEPIVQQIVRLFIDIFGQSQSKDTT